jgi:hypothetical protein
MRADKSQRRALPRFNSIGKIKNGLEVGLWVYRGNDGSIVEEGHFDEDVRVDMWRYNLPVKDSIFWNKFSNTSSSIITNIPSFLAVKDSYDSLVYFEYTGTSKIFRLVIGSEKCVDLFTLDQYEKQLYADLSNRKFKIDDTI